MKIALDANRFTDFCKNVAEAVDPVRRADRVFLPFVVLGELRAGFRCGRKSRQNEGVLRRFLQSPRVSILLADEGTTHLYAALFAQLRAAGTPIPTNDLWIAALVLQHDLELCTRDKHFDVLPQVRRT